MVSQAAWQLAFSSASKLNSKYLAAPRCGCAGAACTMYFMGGMHRGNVCLGVQFNIVKEA